MISFSANRRQLDLRLSRLSLDVAFNKKQLQAAKELRDSSGIAAYEENLKKLQEEYDFIISKCAQQA